MSEAAPREPDVCPRCGAHLEAVLSDTEGTTQRRTCPSCRAELVRECRRAVAARGRDLVALSH